jgi:hypothetical protein|uniref:Uncharacterized protein n=1 Tax=Zea mays TaxID=4577 RepID=C4IYI1_MAIZE|nr:unknown [Zea mays]
MHAEFGLTWGGHSSQLLEILALQGKLTMFSGQGLVFLGLK